MPNFYLFPAVLISMSSNTKLLAWKIHGAAAGVAQAFDVT
jgi:hypothetical protein